MKKLLAKIRKILHDRRTRRFLTRFVSGIAALVVFVTTYALVLPAITMEKVAACGIEEHQHDDSCYSLELVCGLEESDGHKHDDSCYSKTSTLICGTEEHEHSVENGCYDDEGNLICEITEHRHSEECYEEVRELTCQIPESEGHRHTDECYEKVLACGKEVHIHSTACYENDPVSEAAVAASTGSASAATTSAGSASSAGMTLSFEGEIEETIDIDEPVDDDKSDSDGSVNNTGSDEINGSSDNDGPSENGGSRETTSSGVTDAKDSSDAEVTYGSENAGTGQTEASNAALTNTDNSSTSSTSQADTDQYIPQLDAIDLSAVLNSHTGIYYHHVADEETVEDSSAVPAEGWNRIPNNIDRLDVDEQDVELGKNDLLRVYLSYTIPAGSLNATNPVARYRLPSNLHLTDPQVKAINENVNGVAAQYVDMSNLEITDPDKYNACLGLEAVEGTRTPDKTVEDYLREQVRRTGTDAAGADADDAAEYISAVVRVENVYDTDGIYGEKDAYLGQDLIFTFVPYSIEKNQHEYDSTGKPTKAGKEIEGWFTFDLNMGQVDFEEPEITTSTVEAPVGDNDIDNGDAGTEDDHIENDNTDGSYVEDNGTRDDLGTVDPAEDAPDAANPAIDDQDDDYSSEDNNPVVSEDDVEAESAEEDPESSQSQNQTITKERAERTAEIVFVEEGWDEKGNVIDQISTTLKVVEETVVETQDADQGDDQERDNDEIIAETATENASEAGTADTEETTETAAEDASAAEKDDTDKNTDQAGTGETAQTTEEPEPVAIMPAMSFSDSIKVTTGRPAGIDEKAGGTLANAADALPKKAEVFVRVEADEGTFPAGTTMVLKAVSKKDMAALSETVADTVEKESPDSAEDPASKTEDKQENKENQQNSDSDANTNIKTYGFQAVDITFLDKDGNEIQPAKPVRVALTSKVVEQVREEAKESMIADPVVVHVDDEGNAEQMDLVEPEEIEPAQGRTEKELLEEAEKAGKAKDTANTSLTDDEKDDSNTNSIENDNEGENKAADEPAAEDEAETEATVDDNETAEESDSVTDTAVETDNTTENKNNTEEADIAETGGEAATDEDSIASEAVDAGSTLEFQAGAFSIYAIVYTVDFHWEVDGKKYDFSMPGGGFISFSDLVEVLGVAKTSEKEENPVENAADTDIDLSMEAEGVNDQDVNGEKGINNYILKDIVVSEKTREFVEDVESVKFSSPELVWVGKVENENTV